MVYCISKCHKSVNVTNFAPTKCAPIMHVDVCMDVSYKLKVWSQNHSLSGK